METLPRAQEFRDRVLANWTDAQTIASWRRWHSKIAHQLQAVSSALISAAAVRQKMAVLDLASGSGEPALRIAQMVRPNGYVVAADVSRGMLDLARENAAAAGIRNVAFCRADAERLPFDDETFDAVTCRMGVMFFVDTAKALAEIRRVLRPGGRAAFSAWGTYERSSFFRAFADPFAAYAAPPAASNEVPHPLRFAQPQMLAGELRRAGFRNVEESERIFPTPWPGPPEEQWNAFCDLAAPACFGDVPEPARSAAVEAVLENLRRLNNAGQIWTQAAVVIASAKR